MKVLRWFASFPLALLASFLSWFFETKIFSGMHATYGGGFFYSLTGMFPVVIASAVPTVIFVLAAVVVAPSKERSVCFVFFALSPLFSAGGIQMLMLQDGHLPFWVASAAGVIAGAVVGLVASLRIQHGRTPIQSP